MKHVLEQIAFAVAVIVVVVGCGGSASATPTSSAPPVASSAGSPTSSLSTAASPSGNASTPPAVSVPSLPAIVSQHADPDLEALLPAEVSGTAMQRSSVSLAAMLDAGGDRATVDAFLQGIGKSEADGSVATAFDATNTLGGGIIAFKIRGVDTAVLLPAIVAVEQSDLGGGATTRQATVGGKSVTVVSVGTGVNDTEWVFGRGDVVFVVHASDEALASAFLQALQ